jgi:hypothetical protein
LVVIFFAVQINFFSKRKVSPESPFKERRGGSGFTTKKEKNKKRLYIPDCGSAL